LIDRRRIGLNDDYAEDKNLKHAKEFIIAPLEAKTSKYFI
jgi:hypothetical protein